MSIRYRWTKQDLIVYQDGKSDIYPMPGRVTPYLIGKPYTAPTLNETTTLAESGRELQTKSGQPWTVARLILPSGMVWKRLSEIDALRSAKTLGEVAQGVAKNLPSLPNSGANAIDSRIFNYWENTNWRAEQIASASTTQGWLVGGEKAIAQLSVPGDLYVPWTAQPAATKKAAPKTSGAGADPCAGAFPGNSYQELPPSFAPVKKLFHDFDAIRLRLRDYQGLRKAAVERLCGYGGTLRAMESLFTIARYALDTPVGLARDRSETDAWEARKERFRMAEAAFREVAIKTADMYRAWGKKVPPINPLGGEPDLLSTIQSKAYEAVQLVQNPASREALQTFVDDPNASTAAKQNAILALRWIIEETMEEVAKTEAQSSLATAIEVGFTSQQDNLFAVLQNAGSVTLASVGNLPGPDSLSVSLAKLLATWQIFKVGGKTEALKGVLGTLAGRVIASVKFTPAETREFRTKVDAKDWMECESMLGAKLQQGKALNSVISALNVIQLISALQGFTDPGKDAVQAFADVGNATIATVTGTVAMADKFTSAIRARSGSLGNFKCFVGSCAQLLEEYAVPISTSIAILGAISGSITFAQGWTENDNMKMAVGGLQFGSGVFVAMGVALSIPGAQPIGLVLGAIAVGLQAGSAIHEALKSGLRRAMESLMTSIRDTKSSWNNKPLAEVLGLSAELAALEQAVAAAVAYTELPLTEEASIKYNRTQRLISAGLPSSMAQEV